MLRIPRKFLGRARGLARRELRRGLLNWVFPALDRAHSTVLDPSLAPLHDKIRRHLRAQAGAWANSYTAGYPYQGFRRIGIMGARPVEERFRRYAVDEYFTSTARVLDIGCNTGFLALHVAPLCGFVDGVELNPHLVAIGRDTQDYLGIENVEFHCVSFEDFEPPALYDVVFSFANHHTIDGNLDMGFGNYIKRVHGLLESSGILLFETHNVAGPGLGGPGDDGDLDAKFDIAEQYFNVVKYKMVPVGRRGIQDINRLFIVMQKKPHNPDAKRTLSREAAMRQWSYS